MRLTDFDRSCRRWLKRFGLSDWRLNVKAEPVLDLTSSNQSAAAVCEAEAEYRIATITADIEKMKAWDEWGMEQISSHEVAHLILKPLDNLMNAMYSEMAPERAKAFRDWFHNENEQMTERIARAFREAKW